MKRWPPSTKDLEKQKKQAAKDVADSKARAQAHRRLLAKKGSGARWPF